MRSCNLCCTIRPTALPVVADPSWSRAPAHAARRRVLPDCFELRCTAPPLSPTPIPSTSNAGVLQDRVHRKSGSHTELAATGAQGVSSNPKSWAGDNLHLAPVSRLAALQILSPRIRISSVLPLKTPPPRPSWSCAPVVSSHQ